MMKNDSKTYSFQLIMLNKQLKWICKMESHGIFWEMLIVLISLSASRSWTNYSCHWRHTIMHRSYNLINVLICTTTEHRSINIWKCI